MDRLLSALESSHERLRAIVTPLDDTQIELQAYPTEWRIADVMSHIGSGAVITTRRLDDGLAGSPIPDDFAPLVWAEWDAKSPRQKTDDGLTADRVMLDHVRAITPEKRDGFRTALGRLELDFAGLLGLRLNEHTLHTWDIEVALDPAASLHPEQTELVVDNLTLVARFMGKPGEARRTAAVHTTEPLRQFTIELGPEAVTLTPGTATGEDRVELPAEAFVRLLYGRLDPEHTPDLDADPAVLDDLRHAFRGT